MSSRGEDRAFGSGGMSSRGPVPRAGENVEFDRYFNRLMDGKDADETDFAESRRAEWATWKIPPPSRRDDYGAQSQEDDDLAKAIAMSVQDHSAHASRQQSRQASVIPVDDESDDELRRAIELSKTEERPSKRVKRDETPEEERKLMAEAIAASLASEGQKKEAEEVTPILPTTSTDASIIPTAPAGLSDRAKMEQERLARQQARQNKAGAVAGPSRGASQASTPTSTQGTSSRISTFSDLAKRNGDEEATSAIASSSKAISSASKTSNGSHSKRNVHPLQGDGPFPMDAAGQYYPDGELRHTALTIGDASDRPTFSPHDIVGKKSEITFLIMCSFVIDDQWLETILPPPGVVPTIVIRPGPDDKHRGKLQVQVNSEVWSYPKMMGDWGSAHMKFFWIWYKTGRLRVVISTANMVPYDWDWIENTVFVQDFLPKKADVALPRSPMGDDFLEHFRHLLVYFKVHRGLKWLKESHTYGSLIPLDVAEGLADLRGMYDWSRVRVRLVMSVPGKYTGQEEMIQYGMCRLGRVLKEEGWLPPLGEKIIGEYQGSSLGSYTIDWLDTFYQFMNGKDPQALVNRPKPKAFPPIKVLFPSLATVDNSLLKREGGGTMFVGQSWKQTTRHLFHDANSKRGGVLMHAKVMIAIFEKQENPLGLTSGNHSSPQGKKRKIDDTKEEVGGWVYVGSHNFTPSAWGTVKLNDRPPTSSISNYELGIVFPLPRESARAAADAIAPYKRPARPYSSGDMPWDQKMKGQSVLTANP